MLAEAGLVDDKPSVAKKRPAAAALKRPADAAVEGHAEAEDNEEAPSPLSLSQSLLSLHPSAKGLFFVRVPPVDMLPVLLLPLGGHPWSGGVVDTTRARTLLDKPD